MRQVGWQTVPDDGQRASMGEAIDPTVKDQNGPEPLQYDSPLSSLTHRRDSCSPAGKRNDSVIVVAGATGDLGGRITRALREGGTRVTALVRHGAIPAKIEPLAALGVTIASVDLSSHSEVAAACAGASCVISALAGLRDVIMVRPPLSNATGQWQRLGCIAK